LRIKAASEKPIPGKKMDCFHALVAGLPCHRHMPILTLRLQGSLAEIMSSEEPIRIQKFIADSGLCSRRNAEVLIAQGEVWVNGAKAVAGQKVTPGADKVIVRGKLVRSLAQPRITLAVNKPRGLICSTDDPHNPDTVFMLLPREYSRFRFFCAGRLDKDSEGLVILTTDGDLAHRLMHPSSEVTKRYYVSLEKTFPSSRLPRLVKGLTFEGERLKVERAAIVNPGPDGTGHDLDIHMHHGKKREIRLLFAALGYTVHRLRRYQIGAVRLKGIPLRGAKQLASKEIEQLFRSPSTPHAELQATEEEHSKNED
jgi:23S rRNA pseudouridine2605 synthase